MYSDSFGRICCLKRLCTVLGFALIASIYHTAAFAEVIEPVSAWQTRVLKPNQSSDGIPVQYCTLRADFANGANLVIARDLSGSMSGAYQVRNHKMPQTSVIQMDMNIDQTDYRHYQAKPVQGNTLIFSISHDYDLVDSLMAGSELAFSYHGHETVYGLKGSADGFRSLNACLRNLNNGNALPWQSGVSGPGPLLAPQFNTSRNNIPKTDAFNNPDNTYIIVHRPKAEHQNVAPVKADMPKVEAAAVRPVEAEPIAEAPSVNKPAPEPQICKIENSDAIKRSLLRNLISQDVQSRIKLASGAEMDIQQQQATESINWTAGQVQAHLSIVPLTAAKTGDETASRILDDLHAACGGSFVIEKRKQYLAQGVRVDEYQAVCTIQDQSGMANISFLSDGFETAILSFEGNLADAGAILAYKSMILGGLSSPL